MSKFLFPGIISQQTYDPITLNYISRMTNKPSVEHIELINDFVLTTKNIINKADVIYLCNINNSNDSFVNLVKNAHNGTISGTGLLYDEYWGFSNPSGTGYVDTNYNPATQGVKYTLNDAGLSIYISNQFKSEFSYPIGALDASNNRAYYAFNGINNTVFAINDINTNTGSNKPFRVGLEVVQRTSSSSTQELNQNITNIVATSNADAIPNININLFKLSGYDIGIYTGGLSFTYIGASLTDAEFTVLNNAVNDYLIQCLFLKYGQDNWGVKMAKSYFLDLHNFEKYEAWEIYEFIKRHQPDYIYIPLELSTNSGAAGMTDWVDSNSDGLADGWGGGYGLETYSIVTGNGFTGNAQRVVASTSSNNNCIRLVSTPAFILGRTYKVSFKYRSSGNLVLYIGSGEVYDSLAINTGNALYYEKIVTPKVSSAIPSFFIPVNKWFEIDEVSVKEVTESDTVTFNKCLNSGFGLGTDWINPTNGLAQYWTAQTNNQASIVTGNGFTGNAQRLERITSSGVLNMYQAANLVVGRNYTIHLKYRSNITIALYNYTDTKYSDIGTANTGGAAAVSFAFTASHTQFKLGTTASVATGSYFEVDELLIIDNSNSQFLYNVFGINGLNKTVCNYLMLFKAGGNLLVSNAWGKTGATLRWNQDGAITSSNTMPAYIRGTNLGIVTVTSTDGWNGVTVINFNQTVSSVNSFYGNFPLLEKIKTSGNHQLIAYQNRCKFRFTSPYNLLSRLLIYNCSYPSLIRYNINNVISSVIDNLRTYSNGDMVIEGNFTLITNQITSQLTIDGVGSQRFDKLTGGLQNMTIPDTMQFIYVARSGIVAGTSTWNKNCAQLTLSDCRLPTSAVDAQLAVINNYFAITTPIKNLTINLSGASMGIPTGGANNVDLLGIVAKHTAVGFTATIIVRTS